MTKFGGNAHWQGHRANDVFDHSIGSGFVQLAACARSASVCTGVSPAGKFWPPSAGVQALSGGRNRSIDCFQLA